MVAWLEELLFQAEVGNLVLHTFEVAEIREGVLRARVQGRPLEEHEELVGPAVKAVTRHDLAVQRIEGRWRARVIFDI